MHRVTVIGAGVAGLCVARALLDRGAQVTVLDRCATLGPQACSWWAGGMLAPFCEGESAEEPVVRLGQEAADWWAAQTRAVHRRGSLVVSPARDTGDLARFARRTRNFRRLESQEIAELEPDLAGRFAKALLFESEAHLAPRAALQQLRVGLERDGAVFEQADADPEALARHGLTIDCRGFQARAQIPDLRGVKGEMLVLSCPEVTLSRPVRLLHPRVPLYVVPRGDGVFMLGATMVEGRAGPHITARALLELLSAAYALTPAFAEAEVIEIGVDSRPAFADNLPRIRRNGNLIRANGLYRHGFLLAPALARMVATLIFDNITPEVMDETAT
ncbi:MULTISPECIES: FAD-dependent oxidoreductase [Roseobacteraceae]|jgi:glycine oxidase|uniref:D-amino-acid oxidase n=1 Tax=Pseudosulfitobacter pseudonitzschiae TaxID=1402135 RepID=A0A221K742_9RHOB|nr:MULTISPECIES: FAD-dependent oxidoreductase [Roseobacteraceae]ASM74667.1 glycine oxidase [Pseudosulfitobacter pseudonitzschiae]